MLTYGSVCSGIESASVAWEVLGLSPTWFSEVEPFPCAVLAHHWPDVPNLGDMTKLAEWMRAGALPAPDILVGGTPCQAFSVAGVRKGLEDERGQLTIHYGDLANAIDEQRGECNGCVIVWENVPGVLSDKTNAFGCFLGLLAGEDVPLLPTGDAPPTKPGPARFWGWCKKTKRHWPKWTNAGCVFGPQRAVAWRVIDAQYFGVAQRRRRVFVVASAREGFDPTKVLFEFEGVRRDSPPSREKRQGTPTFALSSFAKFREGEGTLRASGGDQGGGSEHLVVGALDTQCGFEKAAGQSVRAGHIVGTLTARGLNALGARDVEEEGVLRVVHGTQDPCTSDNLAFAQGRNSGGENVVLPMPDKRTVCTQDSQVRKLTPVECERLQGFPDNHTRIPYRNKPAEDCPDGPRYKAIGNSKAVPCIQFVGARVIMEWFRCT